ncbi:MAG TPA: trypsin-like peptidase domain-containing protein [Pseudonocardia sp.]
MPSASGPGAGAPGQPGGGVPDGASQGTVPPGPGGPALFNEPAEPPARTGSRRKWALAGMALALVAALVGGTLGGVIGYQIASNGGRLSVLDAPLPDADSTATPPTAVEQVAQRTLPTVVQLRVSSAQQAGAGSGMVLSPDGLILTNNHVIELAVGGAGQIVVLFQGGKTAPADIIGRDPTSDIALVKARNVSGLSPITLGNSEAVRVGQQVVAIGSPLGLGGTVTTGIVSALNRAVSVGPDGPPNGPGPLANSPSEVLDAIQTDAPINPGNSGGPLVDIAGRVIGINTAIASIGGVAGEQSGSVGLGFAIPINQAKRIAEEIERNGQANMPVLKVQVQSASRPAAVTGVVGAKVIQVDPAGPGGQAGLKVNDVIVKVDERPITTGDELVAAVRSHAPGDAVSLALSDGRVVRAVLGAAPVVAGR